MIITTKYMSDCPTCGKVIPTGTRAQWEPGTKPMHMECKHDSVSSIQATFQQTHPKYSIEYIGEIDNQYHFLATNPKTGHTIKPIFTKAGTRVRVKGELK